MSNDYAALIKNAKDIPVLNTGIDNSITSENTFPTNKHPSLIVITPEESCPHHQRTVRYTDEGRSPSPGNPIPIQ